jgi:hypothetical protein
MASQRDGVSIDISHYIRGFVLFSMTMHTNPHTKNAIYPPKLGFSLVALANEERPSMSMVGPLLSFPETYNGARH